MDWLTWWRNELSQSLAEFANLAAEAQGVHFTYGLLGAGALWPIRVAVQEANGEAITAIEQLAGTNSPAILAVLRELPRNRLEAARLLACRAKGDEQLRIALVEVLRKLDAFRLFGEQLAPAVISGSQGATDLPGQIQAALLNTGGFTSINELSLYIGAMVQVRAPSGPEPQTVEAYLRSILKQKLQCDTYYVPLSGHPEGKILPRPEGFIPLNFVTVFERRFPRKKDQPDHFDKIEDVLQFCRQFILLGAPGSGKTTILQKLLLDAAERASHDPSQPVPLLVRLGKDWPENAADGPALVLEILRWHHLEGLHPSQLMLLLDGLNEIDRQQSTNRVLTLHEWLCNNPEVGAVITCRTGYDISNFLPNTPRVRISELDDKRIRDFMFPYLGSEGADALMRKLQPDPNHEDPHDLIRLARNPFFLMMLTFTYQSQGNLPSNQGSLFKVFVESCYERESKSGTTVRGPELQDVLDGLGAVALGMHELGVVSSKMDTTWAQRQLPSRLMPAANQLWWLGREMGVLQLTKEGHFLEYAHDLLTAYFAAEALSVPVGKISDFLNTPVFAERKRAADVWHSVIYMLAGIVEPDVLFPSLAHIDPFLAARSLNYLSAEHEPSPENIDIIIEEIGLYLGDKDANARAAATEELIHFPYSDRVLLYTERILHTGTGWEKRAAIEILRNTSDHRRAAAVIARALSDANKWVRNAASAALEDLGEEAVEPLYECYKHGKAEVRSKIVNLWASIATRESFQYVLEALQDEEIAVQEMASQKLTWPEDEELGGEIEQLMMRQEIAKAQLRSAKSRDRISAIAVLGAIGSKKDVPMLLEMLDDEEEDVVSWAASTLGALGDNRAVPPLVGVVTGYDSTATDLSKSAIIAATKALGLLRDESTAPVLEAALFDRNSYVRAAAAQALGRLCCESSIDALMKGAEDINLFVQANSALSLGLIGSTSALPVLGRLLAHQKERVRGYAALALGFIGKPARHYLLPALRDPNYYVRQDAAVALAVLRDPATCEVLEEALLSEKEHYVRQWITMALGAIGSPEGLAALEYALQDPVRYVRTRAIAALGEIHHPASPSMLVAAIQSPDTDRFTRQQAVLALGRLQAANCIGPLLSLTQDSCAYVRAALAWTLGTIRDERAIPSLIKLLGDMESHIVRNSAAWALGRLGQAEQSVVTALVRAARDPSDFVRKCAIRSLRLLGVAEAANLVTELSTSDPSAYVRYAAIASLHEMPEVPEQAPLGVPLSDTEPRDSFTALDQTEWPRASRTDALELARQKIEEGLVYVVLQQALMDPRESKRIAAREALWRKTSSTALP